VAYDKDRKQVRVPPRTGPGAGHGPQHSYQVLVIESDHPITKGMPMRWQHTRDELYQGQRGPAKDMHILAIAFADKAQRGTGEYEPMIWWIPYGKGRAVTTVLGHVSAGDSKDMVGMRCVGFLTTVTRACEWAATGKVTLPIPSNFPSADKTSTVPLP
jgi:type 1 glutamine amidotransferase